MKKEKSRVVKHLAFALILFVLTPFILLPIYADTETDHEYTDSVETINETDSLIIMAEGDLVTETIDNLPDNDDLFEGYVNREFGIEEDQSGIIVYEDGLVIESIDSSNKVFLDAKDQMALNCLKTMVLDVADGRRGSTAFQMPLSAIGIAKLEYTAEELGVDSIIVNGKISQEAIDAMREMVNIDVPKIISFLTAESPYELYWFDKTKGYSYYPQGGWPGLTANSRVISFTADYIPVWMNVASAYRGSYSAEEWMADISITGAASLSAANARSVVNMYKTELDYEKLVSYKEYICNAVEYNHEAASPSYSGGYGDPWQLIYVFDNDPDTNVVCEGYSKAYQYLCEMSVWHDSDFSCISVTGDMRDDYGSGGAHMWNIITFGNENYLADITNSDSGTIGNNGQLFLPGIIDGDLDSGYEFYITDQFRMHYAYDTRTTSVYDSELVLSSVGFDPQSESDHIWDVTTTASCMQQGIKTFTCSICGYSYLEADPALGHEWGEPEWNWIEDETGNYPAVNAVYTCEHDDSHLWEIGFISEIEEIDLTHFNLESLLEYVVSKYDISGVDSKIAIDYLADGEIDEETFSILYTVNPMIIIYEKVNGIEEEIGREVLSQDYISIDPSLTFEMALDVPEMIYDAAYDNKGIRYVDVSLFSENEPSEGEHQKLIIRKKLINEELSYYASCLLSHAVKVKIEAVTIPTQSLTAMATLSFSDSLNINFYVDNIAAENASLYTVKYRCEDIEHSVSLADLPYISGKGYRAVLANVYSYQMWLPVYISLEFNNGVETERLLSDYEYSVKKYLDNKIKDNKETESFKQLCRLTLDYGANAQIYFTGKTYGDGIEYVTDSENLVNAAYNPDNTIEAVRPVDYETKITTPLITGLKTMSASLIFGSTTSIKVRMGGLDMEGLTVTCVDDKNESHNVTELRTDSESNIVFSITGLKSFQLHRNYYITIKKGSEEMILTYSPYTYANKKWDNGDNEARLCQSMVAYGDAAKEYWND